MTPAVGSLAPVLGHAGPGSTWQAMVVVAAVVLAGVVLAAGVGLVGIASGDDLLLPFAGAAVASSLGALAHEVVSDGVGWALPLGVVATAALLLAAFTPLDLRLPGPLAMGTLALAIVSSWLLYVPLTVALHPPGELLPLADDLELTITAPADGSQVDGPSVEVRVEVEGGSIGPGALDADELPTDPEEAGLLSVGLARIGPDGAVQQQVGVTPVHRQTCTVASPCTSVEFPIEVDTGDHRLIVEFLRGDGMPLAPFVRDVVDFSVR